MAQKRSKNTRPVTFSMLYSQSTKKCFCGYSDIFILTELSMKIKQMNVWRNTRCFSASNIQELTDYNCQENILLSIYPLSFACTSAPCWRRYSTTDTLLYPAAKWSGVDWRPSISLQFTLWTVHSFCQISKTKHTSLYIVLAYLQNSHKMFLYIAIFEKLF